MNCQFLQIRFYTKNPTTKNYIRLMNKSDKIRWLKNEFKPTVHDLWDSHVYKNNPKKF